MLKWHLEIACENLTCYWKILWGPESWLNGLLILWCVCLNISLCIILIIYNPITPSRNIGPLRGFCIWLFLAVCLISFQDFLVILLASSSSVLPHATFGLPRPRLPCGLQSKYSHAVSLGGLRSVWSNHSHFWHRISKSILICLILVHRSLFDMWTGQNMRKILRRHLLIRTCNCFVIVLLAFHVSQPYKWAEFTLELNGRSFVPVECPLEFRCIILRLSGYWSTL
jgi:hypothetical protein